MGCNFVVDFILLIYQSNLMSASQNVVNPNIIEVVAVALQCTSDFTYLLARRGPSESGAGEWEFPGGKIEAGESQRQALVREIIEELSFDMTNLDLQFLGENLHKYPARSIRLYLWGVKLASKPSFELVDHDQTAWLSLAEIQKINLSEGDKPFISLLNF
jgi:8-oxo-dGTP diphosphatase